MDDVKAEMAHYIIVYYSHLLTTDEGKALRHANSTFKLRDAQNELLKNVYLRKGWLSDDPIVLNYLKQGDDQFILNCAKRILKDTPDKVFFNLCPKCGGLARTPFAKQCRFSKHDWH